MLTKRISAAVIMVALLGSANVHAIFKTTSGLRKTTSGLHKTAAGLCSTAVGLLRDTANHPKLTVAVAVGLGLGVYAYKKGFNPFGGAPKGPAPVDLMASAVPVANDGKDLTASQNAELAKQDQTARWYNPFQRTKTAATVAATTATPWFSWAANGLWTGAKNVYNSPTTAAVAGQVKDKAPGVAKTTLNGAVAGTSMVCGWMATGAQASWNFLCRKKTEHDWQALNKEHAAAQ